MTVSHDITRVPSDPEADLGNVPAAPTPRAPQDGSRLVVPTAVEDGRTHASQWVRRSVGALRRALDDGTLHHHRHPSVPAGRRSPNVEVVRAWAAGQDIEAQRRVCPACAAAAATVGS
jgi:hypothetical protein